MNRVIRFLLAALFLLNCTACKAGENILPTEVRYGEVDGQKLLLDAYQPPKTAETLRPAVVLIHGGGWAAGNRSDYRDMGKWLASQGYVAFAISYRLVQKDRNQWPAQLNDVQRAIRWIRAHAKDYQIDPERIGAFGGSAGGHLVACLGTMDTLDNSDPALAAFSSRVSCVVDMCGPTDLTEDFEPKVAQGKWCNEIVENLLGGKERKGAREASPLFHVDRRTPPFLIFHGRKDDIVPLDQSERLLTALKAADVPAELVVFDGGHAIEKQEELLDFVTRTDRFLKTHLKP